MGRSSSRFSCSSCGTLALKWAGRCGSCGEWNTLVEETLVAACPLAVGDGQPVAPRSLPTLSAASCEVAATGIAEFDRVLAGGLVPGSVTLLGGEPGIGKSTLALQAATAWAESGRKALVVAAEESVDQVRRRAERLGSLPAECYLFSTGDVMAALQAAESISPSLIFVDSVQALADGALASPAGSIQQVRECAQLLSQYAKATATSIVLVGHVTKEGSLAGPRTLEHMVDTVLYFEGDRHHALRSLVAVKHRYGPAGELGLFEMTEGGLASLDDPSSLLLSDRRPGLPGSAALPVLEGRRPLLVELQALVAPGHGPQPRRVVQGASSSRVAILLAVIERCCGLPVGPRDVFVSTVGGVRVTEPAGDLAIGLSVASSLAGRPLPAEAIFFGEVGLGGEVRQVSRPERRLAEAARLGFTRAIVPLRTPSSDLPMEVEEVGTLAEAISRLGLASRPVEASSTERPLVKSL